MAAKNYTVQEGYLTADLIQYAFDHLASGRHLFDASHRCFDSAGHLCHLGIELLCKALLLHESGLFPNEHDLVKLRDHVRKHVAEFLAEPAHDATLEHINPFVVLRYPNPQSPVTVGSEDWDEIAALVDAILEVFPEPLYEEYCRMDPTKKGGRVLMSRPKRPDEL